MRLRPLRMLAWLLALVMLVPALLIGGILLFTPNLEISSWPVLFNAISGSGGATASATRVGRELVVREGFQLTLYSANVPKARWLRPTAAGDLLVSQPRLGQILLLRRDANGDGHPDRQDVLLAGLDRPQGIDIADGWLYVGESGAVGRVRFDADSGQVSGEYKRVLEGIPEGGNHWARTVRVGPDDRLYVSVGSSCNACIEKQPWRAAMLRLNTDGTNVELHATGLRNSAGFDWAPWSGELYATDNGRDMLGDDFPPCELNRVVAGGFYGWPFINGDGVLDPDHGAGMESLLKTALSPVHDFRAHNAPLGITFMRNAALPEAYRRAALVALHGSWNRSRADGYKVVLLQWDASGAISESDFLSGFEKNGTVIGRPVDIAEAIDGSFFISDDFAGAIYRVSLAGPAHAATAVSVPAPARAPRPNPIAAVSKDEIARANEIGTALVRKHACTGCHAKGTPMGNQLATVAERYTLDELGAFFLAPTPPMPIFALAADERRALAIHLFDMPLESPPP